MEAPRAMRTTGSSTRPVLSPHSTTDRHIRNSIRPNRGPSGPIRLCGEPEELPGVVTEHGGYLVWCQIGKGLDGQANQTGIGVVERLGVVGPPEHARGAGPTHELLDEGAAT